MYCVFYKLTTANIAYIAYIALRILRNIALRCVAYFTTSPMSQYSEFYVIWKIERQVSKFSLCKIVEIKIGGKTRFENLLKQLFH